MKNKYIYPAIFNYESKGIAIEFPDFDWAYTCGDDEADALYMAQDCLELVLYSMEEDGEEFPEPTPIRDIQLESGQVVVMITINMRLVRDTMENRTVKKTLTLPAKLNKMAEEEGLNFSALLRSALIKELDGEDRWKI